MLVLHFLGFLFLLCFVLVNVCFPPSMTWSPSLCFFFLFSWRSSLAFVISAGIFFFSCQFCFVSFYFAFVWNILWKRFLDFSAAHLGRLGNPKSSKNNTISVRGSFSTLFPTGLGALFQNAQWVGKSKPERHKSLPNSCAFISCSFRWRDPS